MNISIAFSIRLVFVLSLIAIPVVAQTGLIEARAGLASGPEQSSFRRDAETNARDGRAPLISHSSALSAHAGREFCTLSRKGAKGRNGSQSLGDLASLHESSGSNCMKEFFSRVGAEQFKKLSVLAPLRKTSSSKSASAFPVQTP